MDSLKSVDVTKNASSDELEKARALIFLAAEADGQKALSDKTLMDASSGAEGTIFKNFYKNLEDASPVATGAVTGIASSVTEIDLVVSPAQRGKGYGSFAFAELLKATAQPAQVKVWVHGEQPAADSILRGHAFTPSRTLLRLASNPENAHSATKDGRGEMPDGFFLENFTSESSGKTFEKQIAELTVVNARAFANHPEQGALTADDFKKTMLEDWFSPKDLLLCRTEDGTLAGFGWVKTLYGENSTETELYALGVDPDFAGRGLGHALMGAVYVRMAEHDPQKITLYVEGDNEPALKVYYKAGFELDKKSIQWAL